jgi:hypothetical protein
MDSGEPGSEDGHQSMPAPLPTAPVHRTGLLEEIFIWGMKNEDGFVIARMRSKTLGGIGIVLLGSAIPCPRRWPQVRLWTHRSSELTSCGARCAIATQHRDAIAVDA